MASIVIEDGSPPNLPPERPLFRSIANALLALLPAVLFALILDLLMDPGALDGASSSVFALLGVSIVVGLTVLAPFACGLGVALWSFNQYKTLAWDDLAPNRKAALVLGGLLAGAVSALVYLFLFRGYFSGLGLSFLEKKRLAGTVLGIASIFVLIISLGIGVAVSGGLVRWLSKWPEARAAAVVRALPKIIFGFALLFLVFGLYLQRSRDNLHGVAQVPIMLFAWSMAMLLGVRWFSRFLFERRHLGAIFGVYGLIIIGVFSGLFVGEQSRVESEQRLMFPRFLMSRARAVVDGDGDGFSPILGGGDCDDSNASIHPAALEIAGNGLDDDCMDGDAPAGSNPADLSRIMGTVTPTPDTTNGSDTQTDSSSNADAVAATDAGIDAKQTDAAEPVASPKRPKNVILILVDTLRADHISGFGYERPTSPNIDKLIERGTGFPYAYAQANNTPRSIPSIFTSLYPSEVPWGGKSKNFPAVQNKALFLAEALRELGVYTAAITTHFYFKPVRNIRQGFRSFRNGTGDKQAIRDSNYDISSPRITRRSIRRLKQLKKKGEPFFLFIHYADPHGSYMGHKKVQSFGKTRKDRYDREILFTDGYLGKLFEALDKLELTEETGIVLLADHGEAFKEHRFNWHGHTVYDEEIKVPLILAGPGIPPQKLTRRVGLIDVFPTIYEWMGGDSKALEQKISGRSLLPAIQGTPSPMRPVYSQLLPYPNWKEEQHALIVQDLKVLYHKTRNIWELFDLSVDPREQKNLIDEHPHAASLKAALKQYMAGNRNLR